MVVFLVGKQQRLTIQTPSSTKQKSESARTAKIPAVTVALLAVEWNLFFYLLYTGNVY